MLSNAAELGHPSANFSLALMLREQGLLEDMRVGTGNSLCTSKASKLSRVFVLVKQVKLVADFVFF
jgi:hypothetical protein